MDHATGIKRGSLPSRIENLAQQQVKVSGTKQIVQRGRRLTF